MWSQIRGEILGEAGGDSDSSSDADSDSDDADDDSSGSSSSDDEDDGGGEAKGGEGGGEAEAAQQGFGGSSEITDMSGADLVNLRRTIYLTIMSSMDFEECGHKIMKMGIPPGRENELVRHPPPATRHLSYVIYRREGVEELTR
jgi:hypothetical protein